MQKIPKRTHAKDPKEDTMREHIKEPRRPLKLKKNKKIEKREGAALLSFIPDLCLCLAPLLQFGESFHIMTCITMWGTLHYRTWLVYSNDEPPQKCSRSS